MFNENAMKMTPLSMCVNYNNVNKYLILQSIFILMVNSLRIPNIIPHYCDQNIDTKILPDNYYEQHTIRLNFTDPKRTSFINIGANMIQGTTIPDNYRCLLIITSPKNTGLILTFNKVFIDQFDNITISSGNNPRHQQHQNQQKKQRIKNDGDLIKIEDNASLYKEVVTLIDADNSSSIIINYEPLSGITRMDTGFELAITLYREKEVYCGDNLYDCNNERCIETTLQCDGFNNCGNDLDEYNCPGHLSWWSLGILIPIAIIVVVLAIFVWIRMSKG